MFRETYYTKNTNQEKLGELRLKNYLQKQKSKLVEYL